MKKDIKEILSIDIKFLLKNSKFLINENMNKNNHRKYLVYDLQFKFLDIFNQMGISVFGGVPSHLEFRTKINEEQKIKNIIQKVTGVYGPDQNNFTEDDWNQKEHFAWWFTNKEHEKTVDDPFNTNLDHIYYGIMINPYTLNGFELVICDYFVLESEKNRKLATAICGSC